MYKKKVLVMQRWNNKIFVAGEWKNPHHESGLLEIQNKYSLELMGSVKMASSDDIELALSCAERAWKTKLIGSAEKRWELLGTLISALKNHKEQFIETLIEEIGKPRTLSEIEFDRSIQTLELCRSETLSFAGDVVAMDYGQGIGRVAMTSPVPVGPILCITPFNFPLNLLMHKLGPAIAVGCPVVIKPSPLAPLVNQLVASAIESAEFPKGLVSILNISDSLASKLATDPRIKLISFTGSAEIGWKIKKENSKKKVVLELGGNAAVIVTEKSDWKKASRLIALSGNMYAGQICISTQRIFVESSIRDQFQRCLIEDLKKIECGDPSSKKVMIGPLINQEHYLRIEKWMNEAISKGAKLVYRGEFDKKHNLLGPILLTETTKEMNVRAQEVFGPLMIIESYNELNEAFHYVNESRYGLQAGIFCQDIETAKLAHQELEVGAVIVNGAPSFRVDSMPYGGVKDSGFGREGVLYKMRELTETRLLVI
jgi:acyl-CoA reductase-like NAD-dependent aldehyde dehydrogenase